MHVCTRGPQGLCTRAAKISDSVDPRHLSDPWLGWGRERQGRCWCQAQQYLSDVGQPYHVGHDAHERDEDLAAVAQQLRELVHQDCDEAFHGAELQGKGNTEHSSTVQSPSTAGWSFGEQFAAGPFAGLRLRPFGEK